MAREHARIFVSIWADDDFCARSSAAQRLYQLLLTQPGLTYAGTLDLKVSRWASRAPDTSVADVEMALAELEAHWFVVVDRDTEEVLVRSYLRRDEVWKQPKILTLALRQIATIQSTRIRSVLRSELLRLPNDPRTTDARSLARTLPDTPWHTPPDTPPGRPRDTPPDTPPDTPTDTHAPGVTAGVRARATRPVTSNSSSLAVGTSATSTDKLLSAGETDISPRTEEQRTNDLTKRYTDHPDIGGMAKFAAIRGIVRTAIRTGRYDDHAIGDALERLAADGRSVTVDTLRIELNGLPPNRAASRPADPSKSSPAVRLLRRMAETDAPDRPQLEAR